MKAKVDHSQPPIKSFFQTSSSQRFASYDATQKALTKALLKTIACDQLPLGIVDSQTFRNLLLTAEPRYVIPSRSTLEIPFCQQLFKKWKKR